MWILGWLACASTPTSVGAGAFCARLDADTGPDAVGVACVEADGVAAGGDCDALDVVLVDKGSVDAECAACVGSGGHCDRSAVVDCVTGEGETLSVYSFSCGGPE